MTAHAQSLDDEPSAARTATVDVAGVTLVADLSGALFWEEQSLLVVSDLHLEKGSSFAARGVLLPPYDTVATLSRLAAVIARHDPRMVIALGDSFHDRTAMTGCPRRTATPSRRCRRGATGSGFPAITIPALPSDLGGVVAQRSGDRPDRVSSRADRGVGRNRRPSASQGAGVDARPFDGAALFCLRRRARGDAGVRRLYRGPEHSRRGVCENIPDAGLHGACARRTANCTASPPRGVIRVSNPCGTRSTPSSRSSAP